MSLELKIKTKHLSEEAKIIRYEERKLKKQIAFLIRRDEYATLIDNPDKSKQYQKITTPLGIAIQQLNSLADHRKHDVRNENRATFLVRTYIAGKPYRSVENKRKDEYFFQTFIVPRVLKMVQKYHNYKATREDIQTWSK